MTQKATGERMKPTTRTYYFVNEWGYFEEAERPQRARIPGLEEFDLFTHFKTFVTGRGGFTWVSEGITGLRVDHRAGYTRKETLEHFRQYATEPEFIANLRKQIQAATAEGNISPRYWEAE